MAPRPLMASCLAEAIGTFLLVLFGCGSVHVAVLTGDLAGLWQIGVVWGIAIMVAIYVVGPVSGAHINPAITVGLAAGGLFPWRRAIPYVLAQLAGAFLAAAMLYSLFQPYLLAKEQAKGVERGEPGSVITAMCYGEYFPNPGVLAGGDGAYDSAAHAKLKQLVSVQSACLAEFLGTFILGLVVVAVTEPGNIHGPRNMAPVFIGLTVAALICIIAPLTQACFNPARDFGPRLFAYLAGWGEIALPGPRGAAALFAVYIASPIIGAVAGIACYQKLLRPYVLDPSSSPPAGEFPDVA